MSQRYGVRGDGFGNPQRERTGVVIAGSGERAPIVLNRIRATWDAEIDIDALPPPQRKPDQKPPLKR
ncbi:MAG TPA: hypothetical protein VFP91_19985 [Vicinamibacterales bacterium]|nr:hypothetical protein [Vicinamibacterales bacterium]